MQDAHTLLVHTVQGGEEAVHFQHAILATGSRPTSLPDLLLDSPRVLNSTTALELRDIPQNLLVIGGGYIGLELGTVYAALGTQVTVVELTGGLLPGVDRDLVGIVAKRLAHDFQAILLNTKVVALQEDSEGIRVTFGGRGTADRAGVRQSADSCGAHAKLEWSGATYHPSPLTNGALCKWTSSAVLLSLDLCHRGSHWRADAGP